MPSISSDIGTTKTRSFGVRAPARPAAQPHGQVAELSKSALSIKGTASEVLITRDGAIYDYHGFQDIPTAIQESLGGTFVSTLKLSLRNGDTVIMAEVRTASSPGDRQH